MDLFRRNPLHVQAQDPRLGSVHRRLWRRSHQSLDNPLGVGGVPLHEWAFATRTFKQMLGSDGGTRGVDDDFAARGFNNIGAWIFV